MDFENLLDDLAARVARKMVDLLREGDDFLDQSSSPLGNRRHVAAIRSGELRGRRVGRRWIATRRDVDLFISEHDVRPRSAKSEEVELAKKIGVDHLFSPATKNGKM